jgi:hypothetical protein
VIASGDATTLNTLLGSISSPGSSFSGPSGYIKIKFGTTTFILQWVDASVGANATTTVNYPTAYSSWSRAWCSGSNYDTSGGANFPAVASSTTTGASVVNGLSSTASTTVFAIGV